MKIVVLTVVCQSTGMWLICSDSCLVLVSLQCNLNVSFSCVATIFGNIIQMLHKLLITPSPTWTVKTTGALFKKWTESSSGIGLIVTLSFLIWISVKKNFIGWIVTTFKNRKSVQGFQKSFFKFFFFFFSFWIFFFILFLLMILDYLKSLKINFFN